MKQTITVTCRASVKGLESKIKDYEKDGWRVISKEKGSWWGKLGNTYNWRLILERDDNAESNNQTQKNEDSVVDQLIKIKKLLDIGALTLEEYNELKKRILS